MKKYNGFTLIELLVVIAITGIIISLSLFGIQGARESARDARRKSDLEQIRSGLEIYKSDCNEYPASLGTSLVGPTTGPTGCKSNTYIETVPTDPDSNRHYVYFQISTYRYVICTSLEKIPSPIDITNCPSGCGGTGCNFKITNP
jgi:type II secretion system protein G